jgi:excinuclease ABC subunit B
MRFERTTADLARGYFRLRGDTLEIMPANEEIIYRVETENEKISEIILIDPITRKTRSRLVSQNSGGRAKSRAEEAWIFPAKHFIAVGPEKQRALGEIEKELREQIKFFEKQGKLLEIERLERRTRQDIEMIRELGYCHGIENYSRHLSGRGAGEPPDTLLSYFPKNFLTIIDESHVTIPQISGMYEGDASRKRTLIEYGFRLPSAADNRPLKFDEFERRVGQMIFSSATPAKYEKEKSSRIVEQIIRPTGLVDPKITVHPITETPKSHLQIDDLTERIKEKIKKGERVLVTTLTKKMAEDLTDFLNDELKKSAALGSGSKIPKNQAAVYLHSDVKALDRIRILTDFRRGRFDVLVGVNLLREGLDLPEVTLVAVLDADKEGFLRSETSLIQTIGRAARNVFGEVVLYADNFTGSMKRAVEETERRRKKQLAYNKKYNITPRTIKKKIKDILPEMEAKKVFDIESAPQKGRDAREIIKEKEAQMKEAAKKLDFETAAILRDEIKFLKKSRRYER